MERRVKERLVGAAVLMAAAIILIPEMLSGPKRRSDVTPVAAQSDGSLKTYTIDLSRSPGAATDSASATPPIEESAPPPEEDDVAAESGVDERAPAEEVAPDAPPSSSEVSPESVAATPAPAAAPSTTERPQRSEMRPSEQPEARAPVASTRTPDKPSAPAIASPASVPTTRGWAVQLGSFSSRATAERMVKDLAASGQNAFVMPVKSGASTLYRVRVGPFATRAAANDALTNIRKRVANAAVVAHP